MEISFLQFTSNIFTDLGDNQLKYDCKESNGKFRFEGRNEIFNDELEFTVNEENVYCKRTIKNVSNETVNLKELLVSYDFLLDENYIDDYYYTTENLRLFHNYTIPVEFDRINCQSLNGARNVVSGAKFVDNGAITKRINSSPYMPIPAILIANYNNNYGVVHGSLLQKHFYHNYELLHKENKVHFDIFSSFKSVDFREFKPNEMLVDEWFLGTIDNADDFNHIFDSYTKKLREVLSGNRGKLDTNRHTLIWDSWNDGIFRDVSEKMLLNEATATKNYFHNLEWFQLDDGYATMCNPDVDLDAHGLGVIYEGEQGIDHKKFPNGLKAYTDKIKDIGLKPAIWIGGMCPICSKIYKEQKEWFIDFTYRVDVTQPLDVSNKSAREYMSSAIKTYIKEYGFMGIKHDFWSYAFEESYNNFSNSEKGGYEYRSWWQKQFTDLLDENGYVGVACDISLGNPFIGKYFNNFRYGLDICAGKWSNLLVTMFWGLGCLGAHTGDLFIPNCDSIGILPKLDDTDFIFWINYAIISRSIVEISGRYSQVEKDNNRLKILQKATACLNNGENVYFAKFDYRSTNVLPKIYYINSLYFARDYRGEINSKTFAVFNVDDKEEKLEVNLDEIGVNFDKAIVTDVWTGESKIVENTFEVNLLSHGSKLFTVCKYNEPNICDSNCEILNLKASEDSLDFVINYPCQVELVVNFSVKAVVIDGEDVVFAQEKNKLNFKNEKDSKISLIF